mmetsp:Transcript_5765/g.21794  ORF Transcript_5765/g.21794 Transcript_5765/m.21794 type:complete len:437 (+) Transcript_5765:269-1579(+)
MMNDPPRPDPSPTVPWFCKSASPPFLPTNDPGFCFCKLFFFLETFKSALASMPPRISSSRSSPDFSWFIFRAVDKAGTLLKGPPTRVAAAGLWEFLGLPKKSPFLAEGNAVPSVPAASPNPSSRPQPRDARLVPGTLSSPTPNPEEAPRFTPRVSDTVSKSRGPSCVSTPPSSPSFACAARKPRSACLYFSTSFPYSSSWPCSCLFFPASARHKVSTATFGSTNDSAPNRFTRSASPTTRPSVCAKSRSSFLCVSSALTLPRNRTHSPFRSRSSPVALSSFVLAWPSTYVAALSCSLALPSSRVNDSTWSLNASSSATSASCRISAAARASSASLARTVAAFNSTRNEFISSEVRGDVLVCSPDLPVALSPTRNPKRLVCVSFGDSGTTSSSSSDETRLTLDFPFPVGVFHAAAPVDARVCRTRFAGGVSFATKSR